MKRLEKDKWVEQIISRAAPSDRPAPNFKKWQQQHPKAIEILKSQGQQSTLPQSGKATTIEIWRTIIASRFGKIAACALLVAGLIWVVQLREKEAVSKVVSGAVMVRSEGSSDWIRRDAGWEIAAGDELLVKDGTTVVKLADKTLLTMNAGTLLALRGREDDSRWSVYLKNGVVAAKVTRSENAFEIESSEGRVRTLGTEFTVRMANNVLIERRLKMKGVLPIVKRIMAVTVIAGAVQLQADGEAAVIQAGSSGILVRNEVPLTGLEAKAVLQKLLISSEIGGPMKPILQTHDEYLTQLFGALAARNDKEVGEYADRLSELWQALVSWTRVKSNPRLWEIKVSEAAINKKYYDEFDESEQLRLHYSDAFMTWVENVADKEWGDEIGHVCKQMEEYAEEIRDGGRQGALGLSYSEHCLPSFIAYCEWLKRLPWDDPTQSIATTDLLEAMQRDLQIAQREILHPKNREAQNFVEHSVENAHRTTLVILNRIAGEQASQNQIEACNQLTKTIDILEVMESEAEHRGRELHRHGMAWGEGFRLALKEKPDGEHTRADLLLEQIETSLALCARLREDLASDK